MSLKLYSLPSNYFELLTDDDYKALQKCSNLSTAMRKFVDLVEVTDEDFSERHKICSEIRQKLRNFYPKCDIVPFGSSANGYGFKGCDLDILFLPFPEYCNLDFEDRDTTYIPIINNVVRGKYPKEKLLDMNEKVHLKFVQRIMYPMRHLFKRITFIPAKCPILNILLSNGLECDFSASNRFVVYNSHLLWLYGQIDVRVKPLVMTLRYWAKSLGFISKSTLSSYAFTLLVIFALQNTEPPILPSVKQLISLSGVSRKINDWETAFQPDVDLIPKSSNSASTEELLHHFLNFYWAFDFIHYLVSPHDGKPIPKKDLLESKDERLQSFQHNLFSIQDPFILSRNVSRNTLMKSPFMLAILIAKEMLSENFSFRTFFDKEEYQRRLNLKYGPYSFYVTENKPCILTLSNDVASKLNLTPKCLTPWFKKASQVVYDVLQYGLLVECEVTDKVLWNNSIQDDELVDDCFCNVNSFSDIGDLELLISIQCTVYAVTWANRRTVENNLSKDDNNNDNDDDDLTNSLKLEHSVSKYFASLHMNNVPILIFTCECYKHRIYQVPDIVVLLKPLSSEKYFNSVAQFLSSYIGKTAKKVLLD